VSVVRTPELDGKHIISAIAHGRIASVLTIDPSGQYQVFDYTATEHWRSYSVTTRTSDNPGLNQTILPKGVTADIRDDGELVITVPTNGTQKVVRDKDLLTTMRLSAIGNQVVYRHNGALWSLRMQ